MKFIIREAAENDYNQINELVKEVHKLHVKHRPDVYVDTEEPLEKEYFYKLLNEEKSRIFMVENTENNDGVACSIVSIMNPRSLSILLSNSFLYIEDIIVKKSYRGQGIGKMLFKHVVDFGRSSGIKELQLTVCEFNEDARKFYESMGMSTRNRKMEMNI